MKKRTHVKSSILISISLLLALVPALPPVAYASGTLTPGKVETMPVHLEDTSLRTEYAKGYRVDEDTIQYEISASRIHYKDENGVLKDIVNDLVPVQNASKSTQSSLRGSRVYTNASNDWNAFFSDDEMVEIAYGDHRLKMNIASQGKTMSQGVSTQHRDAVLLGGMESTQAGNRLDVKKNDIVPATVLDRNAMSYEMPAEGISVIYQVGASHLKETIVLKNSAVTRPISFTMVLENLGYRKENGSLIFYSTMSGDELFVMPPMYMVDANGAYSDSVDYAIQEEADALMFTVLPDPAFLNDPSTIYPVYIDPSVFIYWQETTDTSVSSNFPYNSYGTLDRLSVGYSSGSGTMRSLLKFELPRTSTGVVTSAYLDLTWFSMSGTQVKVGCARNTGPFTASTTYVNAPGYVKDNPCMLYTYAPYQTNPSIYVGDIVKSWSEGTYTNYGFTVYSDDANYINFYSSRNWYFSKPKLTVTYSTSQIYKTITLFSPYAPDTMYEVFQPTKQAAQAMFNINLQQFYYPSINFSAGCQLSPMAPCTSSCSANVFYRHKMSDRIFEYMRMYDTNASDYHMYISNHALLNTDGVSVAGWTQVGGRGGTTVGPVPASEWRGMIGAQVRFAHEFSHSLGCTHHTADLPDNSADPFRMDPCVNNGMFDDQSALPLDIWCGRCARIIANNFF